MSTKLKEQTINLKIRNKKAYFLAEYDGSSKTDEFLNEIAESLSKNAGIVELSCNNMNDRLLLETAKKIKQLSAMFNSTFLVKNRADIAYLSSADGVNLEQEAIDIKSAKELLGEDFVIGLYIKSTYKGSIDSVKDGADYVIIENAYSTPTEPVISTGLEYAKWVSENHQIPVLSLNNADRTNSPHSIGLTYL